MSLAFLSIVSFHFKRKSITGSRRSGAARTPDLLDLIPMYQIFESNVRCEITKSSVNDAIRAQVSTEKGIDEFPDKLIYFKITNVSKLTLKLGRF